MKLTYKQKIFLYFFVLFALFTAGILLFEQKRERVYKTEALEAELNGYLGVVQRYLEQEGLNRSNIDSLRNLLALLPPNIRVSVIEEDGTVIFDNDVNNTSSLENHRNRPELMKAAVREFGSNIRHSTSTQSDYLYYAKHFKTGYFVRVALPYDIQVQNFIKPDNVFLFFIISLFFAVLVVLVYISNFFGRSIAMLHQFLEKAKDGSTDIEYVDFPKDELGEIGKQIVEAYRQVKVNKVKIANEREKLLQHFHYSKEGLVFFNKHRKQVYANTHFLQYLNILIDKPALSAEVLLENRNFDMVVEFLNSYAENKNRMVSPTDNAPVFETKISKNGKYFNLKVVLFYDNSFEITLNDITVREKRQLMKQEMTNNIAHELRTPIASIRGYLETLTEQKDIDPEKQRFFLERAYSQIIRLSNLIQDISLINKTEEAPEMFELEFVNLAPLLNELAADLSRKLKEHRDSFQIEVSNTVVVEGSRTLLYSIFRNLADNAINHNSDGIEIHVINYAEDTDFYYFSFYDTGVGVEEKHLGRIFERFYRTDNGRSRDTGGSGLGLSIVNNAIKLHKGEIACRNRKEGGLEFLFTLRKKIR